MTKNLKLLIILFCLGCQPQEDIELKKYVKHIKASVISMVSLSDVDLIAEGYAYEAENYPSPFAENAKVIEEKNEISLPDKTWVGCIEKKGKSWALLRDKAGAIHVVLQKKL